LHRKTVTRADLVEALSREVELRASVCADLLEDVLDLIAERLAAGEPVGIVNFGSFSVRHKGARMGRNPKTGEPAPIAPRRVVVFHAARKFRHYANHPEDLPRRARRQLELF
jgi:integration host factor subunit alpha